jgi:hypothetical protein
MQNFIQHLYLIASKSIRNKIDNLYLNYISMIPKAVGREKAFMINKSAEITVENCRFVVVYGISKIRTPLYTFSQFSL